MSVNSRRPRFMEIMGAGILCTILTAGLWPFHAPRNDVKWQRDKDGILFGSFGSIVSSAAFHPRVSGDQDGSLELAIEPSYLASKRTILSFDGSEHPGSPFSLFQYKDGLMIYRHHVDEDGIARTAWFVVERVFREKKTAFVTITLGAQSTSVYVDGILVKNVPIHGTSSDNFSGRLVIGNAPSFSDSWSGEILGLAIYGSRLTALQAAHHYENWKASLPPVLAADESPRAVYRFNERAGAVVRNELDPATSLIIPKRYFVLHHKLLAAPWQEYRPTWGYWEDVAVNVAGFIPLGAWLLTYFSSGRRANSPALLTVLIGFLVSLLIEVLQAWLPTRSSGMTDLITNTLGTAIGVIFCRWSGIEKWFLKIHQQSNQVATMQDELAVVLTA